MGCNREKFVVSILFFTLALTLGCVNSAFSQTADEYVQLGKADLANNSLAAAHANFQNALSLDPNHQGANFFYALTSILMVSSSPDFNRLLDRAGVSASGRNIFDWHADFARDAYGNIILPVDTPTGGDLEAFVQNDVLPVIVQAIDSLGKVGSSFLTHYNWAFETGTGAPSGGNTFATYTGYWYTNEWVGYKLVVNGSEYDIISNTSNVLTLSRNLTLPAGYHEYQIVAPIEIDYGDALAIRGGLNLARAGLLIVLAYDFNVDIDALVSLIDSAGFDIQTDVINAYPQLLSLLPTSQLGEAKSSIRESIRLLSAAVDSIVKESDPQGNDLIVVNPEDGAKFTAVMEEWNRALDGPVVIEALDMQVDLSQFFDHPKSLRDFLPTFTGTLIKRGSFADPTFGRILPEMSATELYRLLGKAVTVKETIPCTGSATDLCLNGSRFRVDVDWSLPSGASGTGRAVPLTSDSGYFWFFSNTNVELLVKILDGRGVNGYFWVFYGAMTDVQYTITITDTVTGEVKIYYGQQGVQKSGNDIQAFSDTVGAVSTSSAERKAAQEAEAFEAVVRGMSQAGARAAVLTAATDTALYLNGNRFKVEVAWSIPSGLSGLGVAIPLTTDSGYFWFFANTNVELLVKVLDGRGVNGHFWFFWGALTDVQYTIMVTDTQTGVVKTYQGVQGVQKSGNDINAF